MSLRDAAQWFTDGQNAMARGDVETAIASFRRAAARNRDDEQYRLALGRALALKHDDEAARALLISLRDAAPENTEVNVELARLAARDDDLAAAVRFYRSALYAPWSPERAGERRRIRVELIRLLLAHQERARALAELLAMSTDLPDDASAVAQIAQLFAAAGDDRHALEQFQHVLRLVPDDGAALAGAGRSAFAVGDYALARTYLRRAPDVDDVPATRELNELVLSNDPLAARLGSAERRRRLTSDLDAVRQRLEACNSAHADARDDAGQKLLQEAESATAQFELPGGALDQDTIEAGVDLAQRVATYVGAKCPPPTPIDRALVLIGREHGAGR